MHANPEYGISEILDRDGEPVGCGEEGQVVLTSFLNPVFPLIRYRIGDLATRGPDMLCRCGREMMRVEAINGRTSDTLYLPRRGYVGSTSLSMVFARFAGAIIEAQVIQEQLDYLAVLVVPARGYTSAVERELAMALLAQVGQSTTIDIRLVQRIPRGATGKLNLVVSRVRHLYPADVGIRQEDGSARQ